MRGAAGRIAFLCASTALVAACSSASPAPEPELSSVTLPNGNGVYKIGEPYEQAGIWYYPREQPEYDETGIASWYGADFHGHRTANGEVFDANGLTAAHPTLPMPVNVRVTNLENGKSLVLRVNDRGPFKRGRIIDVSQHAAELLGFYGKGTAKVRVTYLARADEPVGAPATETAVATAATAAPTGAVQVASLDPVSTPPGTPAPVADVPPPQPQDPVSTPPAMSPARVADVSPPQPQDPVSTPPAAAPLAALDAETAPPQPAADPPPQPQSTDAPLAPPESPDTQTARVDPPVVTTLPVPAVTHIYVQLGAFSIRENAERLKDRLSAAGNLIISPIQRKGQMLYRVRVGPFDDVSAADSALAQVTGLGSSDAKIIVDQ